MSLLNISNKVANKGTTPEGRLTAEEVNLIVKAINSGPSDSIVTNIDIGYGDEFAYLVITVLKGGKLQEKMVKLKGATENFAGLMTVQDKKAMNRVDILTKELGDLDKVLDIILHG